MFALGSFLWVWIGQVISLFGSSLSGFALGIWLYQTTGSASNFALTALCGVLPQMLVSPLAGGLVDRYSRRRMMILGDSGAAACTLALAALFFSGQIQPWHIFLGTALSSACGALQGPAYAALVATAVPAAQLARANGMIQLGQGLAEVLAPAAAGALLAVIGVPGVLLLDLATFVVAVTSVALVQLPSPPPSPYPSPLRAHKACPSSEGGRGNHSRDDFGGKPQKSSLETGETAKSSLLAALIHLGARSRSGCICLERHQQQQKTPTRRPGSHVQQTKCKISRGSPSSTTTSCCSSLQRLSSSASLRPQRRLIQHIVLSHHSILLNTSSPK